MKTRRQSRMETGGVDRLSNLPQDILHQIFSKFDIEEVGRTSILSKKWRYFWTHHPSLYFTSQFFMESPSEAQEFEDSISHVLTLHRSPKITAFSVLSFGSCQESNIHSWVNFALQRDVEELHLQFSRPSFDSLPLSPPFFTSHTQRFLQLGLNISIKDHRVELPLPDSINLPCLQELRLQAMARLSTRFLDTFFSGCPALETLKLSYCEFDRSRKLSISSVQLKNLYMVYCEDEEGLYVSKIAVSAPNLVSFTCTDHLTNIYHLQKLSSLETANLDISRPFHKDATEEEYAKRIVKCLQGIYNVKFLTLAAPSVMEISRAVNISKMPSLLFANLRHLKVTTSFTKEYLQAITYMLTASPGVETLVINRIGAKPKSPVIAEGCPLQHVKSIRVVGAYVEDLEFLKALLKNSINLEKMTIVSDLKSSYQLKRLTKELRTCPRASPTVEVTVLQCGSDF